MTHTNKFATRLNSFKSNWYSSRKPTVRDLIKRASKAKDFIDLSKQQTEEGEIAQALQRPAGTDFAEPTEEEPVVELQPEEQVPAPEEMAEQLEKVVDRHVGSKRKAETLEETPEEQPIQQELEAAATESEEDAKEEASSSVEPPVKWKPLGKKDNLKWERHRPYVTENYTCLLYTSPSPRDATLSRMPSSA